MNDRAYDRNQLIHAMVEVALARDENDLEALIICTSLLGFLMDTIGKKGGISDVEAREMAREIEGLLNLPDGKTILSELGFICVPKDRGAN